jgi:hypothetical protein
MGLYALTENFCYMDSDDIYNAKAPEHNGHVGLDQETV